MIDYEIVGWVLLIFGMVISGVGLVWILAWLGHFSGDIRSQRQNFRFYLPLATGLLLSLVATLLLSFSSV
jgi:hypothetical protein